MSGSKVKGQKNIHMKNGATSRSSSAILGGYPWAVFLIASVPSRNKMYRTSAALKIHAVLHLVEKLECTIVHLVEKPECTAVRFVQKINTLLLISFQQYLYFEDYA